MNAPVFHVAIHASRAQTELRLTGELDVATAPALRSHLDQIDEAVPRVVVDLAGLTFIDAAGIGLLAATQRRLEGDGRTFLLLDAHGPVLRVLELTGLRSHPRDPRPPGPNEGVARSDPSDDAADPDPPLRIVDDRCAVLRRRSTKEPAAPDRVHDPRRVRRARRHLVP